MKYEKSQNSAIKSLSIVFIILLTLTGFLALLSAINSKVGFISSDEMENSLNVISTILCVADMIIAIITIVFIHIEIKKDHSATATNKAKMLICRNILLISIYFSFLPLLVGFIGYFCQEKLQNAIYFLYSIILLLIGFGWSLPALINFDLQRNIKDSIKRGK